MDFMHNIVQKNHTRKFFLCMTCGCPRRIIDTQRIYNYLNANGLVFTQKYNNSDLIILVTCAFNQKTEDHAVAWIKHLLRHKTRTSKVVVAGCLPKINPVRLNKLGTFETVSPTELEKPDDIIDTRIKLATIPDPNENPNVVLLPERIVATTLTKILHLLRFSVNFFLKCLRQQIIKQKIFKINNKDYNYPDVRYNPLEIFTIRIALGCMGECSYCAIKFAVGKIKSKQKSKLIEEFKTGLNKGYKKFIFIAGDVGAYGIDIDTNIVELLDEILVIEGDYKIILKEFNAQWLVRYYDNLECILSKHYNKIDFITLPLQSGSDRILQLMRRPYKIDIVKDCLRRLKTAVPKLAITTHIMVGFPTETEDDFEKTKKLVQEFRFSYVDIYEYNDRPNTEASRLRGKIARRVIRKRRDELASIYEAIYQTLRTDEFTRQY